MAKNCKICLNELAEGMDSCVYCGAKAGAFEPKTISELKTYCEARNMPTEKMRFFIGEDYKEPKAFGIFEDENGAFVVYKNKADGTRAVRYKGADEAYAVRELFIRMQQEIGNQKQRSRETRQAIRSYTEENTETRAAPLKKKSFTLAHLIAAIALAAAVTFVGFMIYKTTTDPDSGYYYYDGDYYYHRGSSWYLFDDDDGLWERTVITDGLKEDPKSYYSGSDYSSSYGVSNFEDSEWYEADSRDDDYDSDWDWDSDWDSGYTDWDSDW
ncbi:MAG: hypothetical protein II425_00265 [Oscillospiraceae bacterium]|nr:hypothetical protein [Oscillospiraceae bacterium]MBQ1767498.1 hypothetical protein [Oscillospiraceae bacterium]MBQ2057573.1 hypothetical protein [Oscillospiraceae bacterium]MBQ2157550.1 hypothetical protein [Oscillospiraceae bacterium]MBQ2230230.1 hypothetical protein [Oscillospiraceae bacterium]